MKSTCQTLLAFHNGIELTLGWKGKEISTVRRIKEKEGNGFGENCEEVCIVGVFQIDIAS